MANKKPTTKLNEIIKEIPDWRVEQISKGFEGKELNKRDLKLVIDMVFINADKKELTDEEMEKNLHQVLILFVLENFVRMGYLKKDKRGKYKDTEAGKILRKMIKTTDNQNRTNSK